jgi:hypothetical protein
MESEAPKYMEVIDPANRTGKVSIPVEQVHNTAGKQAFLNGTADRDLSLCMLFQRGKCRAAAKCHQIHADREFIAQLRSRAKESNCCIAHGDPRANEDGVMEQLRVMGTFVLHLNDESHVLNTESLARTAELTRLFEQRGGDNLIIPARKICRLHQKQQCLFGKDCKNIHLCRDVWRNLQTLAATSLLKPTITTTPPRTPVRAPVVAQAPPASPEITPVHFFNSSFSTPDSSSPESSPGPSSRSSSPPPAILSSFSIPECATPPMECCDVLTPNTLGRAQQALREFFFTWNTHMLTANHNH